ncbi:hypothetical protein CHU98_g12239 [Xylaria longipes]|nr:hypothetical protein CHU98_g12239 [Xylaria longipes]
MPDASIQSPATRPDCTSWGTTGTAFGTVSPGLEGHVGQFAPNGSRKRKGTHDTPEDRWCPKREPVLSWLPTWDLTITNILEDASFLPHHLVHIFDDEGRDIIQVWTQVKLPSEIEGKIRGVVVAAFGGSLGKLEFGVGEPSVSTA